MTHLEKGQPGFKRTIALIVTLGAAGPIATDVYLPAVPQMPEVFNTSESLINLTLMSFFAFMAVGMLVFGPTSDKFGRRRPLIFAILLFTAFGIVAAISSNVWVLIISRAFQGFGGGGMMSIATALVKDFFSGEVRQKILVIIQAANVVAPMCAPLLGSIVLEFVDWRGCFFLMAAFGCVALGLVIPTKETLSKESRTQGSIPRVIGRLFAVGRNKSFIILLAMIAILLMPCMGYVSSASYIYIDFFGLSTFEYSVFFAINAGLHIFGAGLGLFLVKRFQKKTIITGVICTALTAGVSVLTLGQLAPVLFLFSFGVMGLTSSVTRPLVTNILLEQQDNDTGSAASLINFTCNVGGCLGMALVSLPWPNHVFGLGTLMVSVALIALIIWTLLLKSNIEIKGL